MRKGNTLAIWRRTGLQPVLSCVFPGGTGCKPVRYTQVDWFQDLAGIWQRLPFTPLPVEGRERRQSQNSFAKTCGRFSHGRVHGIARRRTADRLGRYGLPEPEEAHRIERNKLPFVPARAAVSTYTLGSWPLRHPNCLTLGKIDGAMKGVSANSRIRGVNSCRARQHLC